jgi:hypothetical protein
VAVDGSRLRWRGVTGSGASLPGVSQGSAPHSIRPTPAVLSTYRAGLPNMFIVGLVHTDASDGDAAGVRVELGDVSQVKELRSLCLALHRHHPAVASYEAAANGGQLVGLYYSSQPAAV